MGGDWWEGGRAVMVGWPVGDSEGCGGQAQGGVGVNMHIHAWAGLEGSRPGWMAERVHWGHA